MNAMPAANGAPVDEVFVEIAELAAQLCGAPHALITLARACARVAA